MGDVGDQLTLDELRLRVRKAKKGERICYFEGIALPNHSGIGLEAYSLYKRGWVVLVQQRISHAKDVLSCGRFAYLAVRTANEL